MQTTMQPQQLDQAAAQARQYYEQLAGIPQPQAAPVAPPVSQFFPQLAPPQPRPETPPQATPQVQQQIALLMQSNEQVLHLLGGISQAINTHATQSTHHAQWIEHLTSRLDKTDRRLDRAITTANIAIIGLAAVIVTSLAINLWPKSPKVASIVPSNPIVGIFPG